ncbi:MAG TPA: hypothetical protein VHX38_22505 [Pseudonocardiaceae bacterium]|jgi:hypothetical protein|nr:hypothetical protein [Pseudonocardiaceae bacterium]
MSESARLERRYRRLLACYPPTARRENGEEILAVLLACAQDGQHRPGAAASVDLLKGAIHAWLWPSWPPRTVRTAVRLLVAAAVAQLAVLVITVVTAGSVHAAVAHASPGVATAQHAVTVNLVIDYVLDSLAVVVWLWRAWRLARGRDGARIRLAVNLTGFALGILVALGLGAAVYAPADLIAAVMTWLIVLVANVLLFSAAANRYYRPQPRPVTPWHGTSGT